MNYEKEFKYLMGIFIQKAENRNLSYDYMHIINCIIADILYFSKPNFNNS